MRPQGLLVTLTGTFEESANLENEIGPVSGTIAINTRGITRINSVGVKAWITYFKKLKTDGVVFKFEECSPSIIEQMNLISTFLCGGEVVSVLIPYSCTKCVSDFVVSCTIQKLKELNAEAPAVKCEKPDCRAVFDDENEEYFYFMRD